MPEIPLNQEIEAREHHEAELRLSNIVRYGEK
jgi:hypothetical protein